MAPKTPYERMTSVFALDPPYQPRDPTYMQAMEMCTPTNTLREAENRFAMSQAVGLHGSGLFHPNDPQSCMLPFWPQPILGMPQYGDAAVPYNVAMQGAANMQFPGLPNMNAGPLHGNVEARHVPQHNGYDMQQYGAPLLQHGLQYYVEPLLAPAWPPQPQQFQGLDLQQYG
ncbi:hypothetical protein LTR53_018822, partial [Teratosphaeriaceae sp. CCFEE 6253]